MSRYGWLGLIAIAGFQIGCGSSSGSGGSALCASPCFAWQYCDTTSRTCLGTLCYRRPIPMPGKVGTAPDVEECGTIASCDFSKGGSDALGHAFGRCEVIACVTDADCDDGAFCNGSEFCAAPTKDNPRGCVAGGYPCSVSMACVEATRSCTCVGVGDADGDGHDGIDCGGDDCDDADPSRYPGNPEVCDSAGHDEDCNLATLGANGGFGAADQDGDGFAGNACCNLSWTGASCAARTATTPGPR